MKRIYSELTPLRLSIDWIDIYNFRSYHAGKQNSRANRAFYIIMRSFLMFPIFLPIRSWRNANGEANGAVDTGKASQKTTSKAKRYTMASRSQLVATRAVEIAVLTLSYLASS